LEKVSYLGQPNCYRLSNGTVELIATTDIGPRLIRYAFLAGENIFAELPDLTQETELGRWKPWGGHRLWAAPEAMPRSYSIDNDPIQFDIKDENAIRLVQPAGTKTAGLEKELAVTLDKQGTGVSVHHKITNRNVWGIDLAPWALTIMNGGGVAILPQEPYRSHDAYLLPARPLVLWHFTNLADPRLRLGEKYIWIHSDPNNAGPQKIGIANKQGWASYVHNDTIFVKRFAYLEGAHYPDYGSNNEVYTAGSFMEIESLGPMCHLEPGESTNHAERWELFRTERRGAEAGPDIDAITRQSGALPAPGSSAGYGI